MINGNKSILVFNAPLEEINILKEMGIKVIEVSNEMMEMKISDILGGLRFETVTNNIVDETVILFSGFSDEEIGQIIKGIRQRFKGGIFAVVTPTSIEWKFNYLVEHLIEEREWYLKNQKGK